LGLSRTLEQSPGSRWAVGLVVAALVAGIAWLALARPWESRTSEVAEWARVAATVRTPDGTEHRLCLLHAKTPAQHQRGLMGVTSLGGCDGMVFTFSRDTVSPFWMRDTPLPLSVAYFDSRGRLVSTADMAPCGDHDRCRHYPPARPYRYALEVPHGRLTEIGVVPGSRLVIEKRSCDPGQA
jgi:uncharacterized membrane protein (UPF0127 family)